MSVAPHRPRSLSALCAVVALALAGATGCGAACDTGGQTPIRYTDGIHPTPTSYMSTDWSGPWLNFPPGRQYNLVHGFGKVILVQSYVAFSATPLPAAQDKNGNFSVSPGNQTVFEQVTGDVIRVRNDTCSHFYVLVSAIGTPLDDGGLDGGGDGGLDSGGD